MKCLKCAECCISKTVSLIESDIERITTITELNFYRIRSTGVKVLNWKLCDDLHMCIFLNPKTRLCEIYEDRPLTCKNFYCGRVN